MLKDIKDNNLIFGGIPVVFGGDFQQIAPVVLHGSRPHIVAASMINLSFWDSLESYI